MATRPRHGAQRAARVGPLCYNNKIYLYLFTTHRKEAEARLRQLQRQRPHTRARTTRENNTRAQLESHIHSGMVMDSRVRTLLNLMSTGTGTVGTGYLLVPGAPGYRTLALDDVLELL